MATIWWASTPLSQRGFKRCHRCKLNRAQRFASRSLATRLIDIVTKRRLTQHQSARIAQRRRATTTARNEAAEGDLGPEQTGLVISHFGAQADVEDPVTGAVTRCHLRANLGDIVAGDQVIWRSSSAATGVVTALLPRRSELHRPDSYGKMRLAAANVTRMLITLAPEPEPHANLIDRYLVVAEHLGFDAVLLVNKADILTGAKQLEELLCVYRELGYHVLQTSVRTGAGIVELQALLGIGTSVFVGQSGVGKSSLIQALLPEEQIKIGDLSEQVRKGRHTTTHARLYHFPTGGDCIDSPGIREFGLWHLNEDEVARGFREFQPYLGQCRFRNCRHLREPGCLLQAALADNRIRPQRYHSFRLIADHLDEVHIQPPTS